jgi:hypothetical protein
MQVLVAELSAMPSRPYDAQGAAGLAEAMRLIVLRDTGTRRRSDRPMSSTFRVRLG